MISFGGEIWNSEGTNINDIGCDATLTVLRALDTSSYEWPSSTQVEPQPYLIPDVITTVIGGE